MNIAYTMHTHIAFQLSVKFSSEKHIECTIFTNVDLDVENDD